MAFSVEGGVLIVLNKEIGQIKLGLEFGMVFASFASTQ